MRLSVVVFAFLTLALAQTSSAANIVQSENIEPHALELPEKKIEDADLNEAATKAIQDAAAQIELKAKVVEAKTETAKKTALKEAEIPVLANFGAKKAAIANPWTRVVFSFFVIAIAAAGLILFSRWYSRRNNGIKDNSKIRILTQHFLGPRKSLAIVRVAGETILIGVTDQNISMLKSLALLDEDIPESTPTNFDQSMTKADQIGASVKMKSPAPNEAYDNLEDFVVSNVKDKVFSKLKNLRPL
jgi:flagellar protein FliO/FliZ